MGCWLPWRLYEYGARVWLLRFGLPVWFIPRTFCFGWLRSAGWVSYFFSITAPIVLDQWSLTYAETLAPEITDDDGDGDVTTELPLVGWWGLVAVDPQRQRRRRRRPRVAVFFAGRRQNALRLVVVCDPRNRHGAGRYANKQPVFRLGKRCLRVASCQKG